MITNHNCYIKLVPLVIFIYDAHQIRCLSVRYWEPMTGQSSEDAKNSCEPSVDSVVYFLPQQILLSLVQLIFNHTQ